MTDQQDPVLESARRLFDGEAMPDMLARAERGEFPEDLWRAVEEFGLPLALVAEDAGGIGLSATQALGIAGLAGRFAVPLPVVETMVANRLLAQAGHGCREGPLTIAAGLSLVQTGDGWHVGGRTAGVPWARRAGVIAVADTAKGSRIAVLPRHLYEVIEGENIAREPRDTIDVDGRLMIDEVVESEIGEYDVLLWLAAGRCSQMAGAMQRIGDMTVEYAGQRHQFGKPLGKFQAIQQNLAVLWENALAASVAARLAAEAVGSAPPREHAVASAKIRSGEAAGIVAAIAHQVHGAIGFTDEYPLHYLTRRLWSWREECGNESFWAGQLGRATAAAGGAGVWPAITSI